MHPAENSGGAFEGFGLTYLEANAYGKPVVGTLDCGAEDAIDDGDNGYLVPQRDPNAVAEALLRLLDDPAAARAMGERGRQRALSRDWSHVVDEYLAIYDRVLGRETAAMIGAAAALQLARRPGRVVVRVAPAEAPGRVARADRDLVRGVGAAGADARAGSLRCVHAGDDGRHHDRAAAPARAGLRRDDPAQPKGTASGTGGKVRDALVFYVFMSVVTSVVVLPPAMLLAPWIGGLVLGRHAT